jgi:hypothetical protein
MLSDAAVSVTRHTGVPKMPQLSSPQDLRRELQRKRRQIAREITAYPSPIAGCDAQFNGLLEDRRRILAGLRLLDNVPTHGGPDQAWVDLAAFKKQAQLGDILD